MGATDLTGASIEDTPVTWEILSLTDELLEVRADLEVTRYVRQ